MGPNSAFTRNRAYSFAVFLNSLARVNKPKCCFESLFQGDLSRSICKMPNEVMSSTSQLRAT